MRYIPTKHLKPGHTLASDLILSDNRIMLRRGKSLTDTLIGKIDILGYQGVYIDDKLSDGIDIKDVISPDLKLQSKAEIQSFLKGVATNNIHLITHHVQTIKKQIQNIVDEILLNRHIMINIIDIRTHDDYTYNHSLNVAVLSTVIGTVLGLSRPMLCELAMGAILHDTGKIFIDKKILTKPDKLTADEFEQIKKHSELGFNFLSNNMNITETSKLTALHHHEQYNGGGYPGGLAGEDIHLFGRIAGVADVYDALVSDRPYRKAMLPSDAIEYIMTGYNTQFDPAIVNALIKKVAPYPIGTCVKLSSGDNAIVVKNHESSSLRPVVKLINKSTDAIIFIDLAHDRAALKITIEDIINV